MHIKDKSIKETMIFKIFIEYLYNKIWTLEYIIIFKRRFLNLCLFLEIFIFNLKPSC
jgi:hypothetical protein